MGMGSNIDGLHLCIHVVYSQVFVVCGTHPSEIQETFTNYLMYVDLRVYRWHTHIDEIVC